MVTDPYLNLTRLSELLGFHTVAIMREWLDSRLFRPFWDEYQRAYIQPARDAGTYKKIGEFNHVIRHMIKGEAGGLQRLFQYFPDMSH